MYISQHDADASERERLVVEATVWRVANPIMCALIGLIAGGVTAAAVGLVLGGVLVAAPTAWPYIARAWARAWCLMMPHVPIMRDRLLSYLPAPVVRVLVGERRRA